ncbi:hypothetical protein HDE76_001679 [Rhodanobacter sp. ANJX3]|jgi:hypothetical protein|uniref:hypothetical protein n=1 Tax=Rhodanobacter sp. ANJX3 TaxID=2723083 RepID=UPI00160F1C45|nr:hypothetical protein [Rhodanobacter sp. ANJX3]MBB5358473.1 hypothetical protein [Rhodanobacter sp. ANJX3]
MSIKRFSNASKMLALGLAVTAAVAMPLSASARGWGGYGGGYGGYHGGYGGYHRGGYWSGGRWIGGAIVAGVVGGLVYSATRPAPVYYNYGPPVVYTQPTVVYQSAPVVTRTVTTYSAPTQYVRDDGYYGN